MTAGLPNLDLARLRAVVEGMTPGLRMRVVTHVRAATGLEIAMCRTVDDALAIATFDRATLLALLDEVQRARDARAFCSGEFPCEASTTAASLERERNDLLDAVETLQRVTEVFEAVRDWYDGDGEQTDLVTMLTDAVADLQADREEVLAGNIAIRGLSAKLAVADTALERGRRIEAAARAMLAESELAATANEWITAYVPQAKLHATRAAFLAARDALAAALDAQPALGKGEGDGE